MERHSDMATQILGSDGPPEEPRRVPDWSAPTSLMEASEAIAVLTNDISLILAHLSEHRDAWCQRTGRSAAEHAVWRRRALLAKVHKERQLRECKRIRRALSAEAELAYGELRSICLHALEAWERPAAGMPATPLDGALLALAEHLDGEPSVAEDDAGVVVLAGLPSADAAG